MGQRLAWQHYAAAERWKRYLAYASLACTCLGQSATTANLVPCHTAWSRGEQYYAEPCSCSDRPQTTCAEEESLPRCLPHARTWQHRLCALRSCKLAYTYACLGATSTMGAAGCGKVMAKRACPAQPSPPATPSHSYNCCSRQLLGHITHHMQHTTCTGTHGRGSRDPSRGRCPSWCTIHRPFRHGPYHGPYHGTAYKPLYGRSKANTAASSLIPAAASSVIHTDARAAHMGGQARRVHAGC